MSDTPHDPEAVIFDEDRESQPVLSIRTNVAVAELGQTQGEGLSELWRSMQERGLVPVGPSSRRIGARPKGADQARAEIVRRRE
jgi:hypothetical protein